MNILTVAVRISCLVTAVFSAVSCTTGFEDIERLGKEMDSLEGADVLQILKPSEDEDEVLVQLQLHEGGQIAFGVGAKTRRDALGTVRILSIGDSVPVIRTGAAKAGEPLTAHLSLGPRGIHSELLPFKVKSLSDLVTHYGDLLKFVESLPTLPDGKWFVAPNGSRYLLSRWVRERDDSPGRESSRVKPR